MKIRYISEVVGILLISISSILNCFGQKVNEYKASNGITYTTGDVVKLGMGSGNNGGFNYVYSAILGGVDLRSTASSGYSNTTPTIKKLKFLNVGTGNKKMFFAIALTSINTYMVDIESAIQSCEVTPCNKSTDNPTSKYDELKKLKELLDQGIITQAEFDNEKKKILERDN